MLRVDRVTKHYGALTAVRDISFVARPGEVLGYLGPNGSGKSTTVQMVVGLLAPTGGTITYEGRDIHEDLLEHRRRIGYVPETPELYSYLTGPEYLMLVGGLRHIPDKVLEEKIERFLELFEILDDRYQPLSSYSKGMKQKVLIAAALLHDPEIVVLDEPASGLDFGSTLVLRELVRQLALDGKVVLFSSHELESVEQVCTAVVILRDGEVVASDSVQNLRELMREPSLEHVFQKLAVRRDPAAVARDLMEAMKR
jgi:ABC-2 type transport system ATP-binding protein